VLIVCPSHVIGMCYRTARLIAGQPTVLASAPVVPDDNKEENAANGPAQQLPALFPDCVVTLMSRLHSLLRVEASGECSANQKVQDKAAEWRLVFQRRPEDDRSVRQSASASLLSINLKLGPMDGKALWGLLRRTFRLRALVALREERETLAAAVDRQRKELLAKGAEEHQCVVCFDSDANTVSNALVHSWC